MPLIVERSESDYDWTVLRCKTVVDDKLFRVLLVESINTLPNMPIYASPWSTLGFTDIEFLDTDVTHRFVRGWRYADWILKTRKEALNARQAEGHRANRSRRVRKGAKVS
jgi:hypothetical protein